MKSTDPARMSAPAILVEIAEILAEGFQRLRAQECKPADGEQISQDHLDVAAEVEAPCGRPAGATR